MITAREKDFFLEYGYLHVPGVLTGDLLALIQAEFDRVWELEKPKVNQHRLLKYQAFIDLIEHPPIVERQRAIFGQQLQLLQYDLLRQEPGSTFPERYWHRDFVFPGDRPLAINTILMLNEMSAARGPTRVIPKSHRGEALPPADKLKQPLPGEVAIYAAPGDAVFINSAIWHTGGRNTTAGLRRGIYLYYGYWWLKRYEAETALPWQALAEASEQRLRLLGIKMPDRDLHQYEPMR
ncbi:MAG: phytanoyl-CoA dioxygenase family protein [Caldilineaceae bacterium]|nr:phytanoyl-CoA dioxygenase family protein [Caldilineaceae bacterium]